MLVHHACRLQSLGRIVSYYYFKFGPKDKSLSSKNGSKQSLVQRYLKKKKITNLIYIYINFICYFPVYINNFPL